MHKIHLTQIEILKLHSTKQIKVPIEINAFLVRQKRTDAFLIDFGFDWFCTVHHQIKFFHEAFLNELFTGNKR